MKQNLAYLHNFSWFLHQMHSCISKYCTVQWPRLEACFNYVYSLVHSKDLLHFLSNFKWDENLCLFKTVSREVSSCGFRDPGIFRFLCLSIPFFLLFLLFIYFFFSFPLHAFCSFSFIPLVFFFSFLLAHFLSFPHSFFLSLPLRFLFLYFHMHLFLRWQKINTSYFRHFFPSFRYKCWLHCSRRLLRWWLTQA